MRLPPKKQPAHAWHSKAVSLSGLSVQGDKVQVQLSARTSPALIPWGLLPASGFNLHANASSHLSLLQ